MVTDSDTEPAKDGPARDLLRDSLAETQTTVRGYDTKAQIVGVGYIFALGVVSQVEGLLPAATEFSLASLLVAWSIVIVPILFSATCSIRHGSLLPESRPPSGTAFSTSSTSIRRRWAPSAM